MKQRKRLLSLICVALMTIEFLPTQLIANATLNSNEVKEVEESENKDIQKEDSDTKKEVVSEEKTADISKLEGETEVKEEKVENQLKNSIFTFFIKEKTISNSSNIKEFLSLKFNRETKKFEVSKNIEKDFSINKDESSNESNNESNELLELRVIDGENKEKLNIKLLDNHDNSEELKKLLELEIKETDYIQINILNTDLNLKIEDDIYGDITKEKEDYNDGVSTLDYINNVRFQIKKDGINTIYNEAPVINGVNDIEVDSENKDALLQGISVTDDHDEIQNSSIQVSSKKLEENKTMVTYSVKDSWGRVTSASRNITYISKATENESESESEVSPIALDTRAQPTSLTDVVFTVKGVRYSNGNDERFKIKFDTNKKLIKVTDMDMRIMTTNNADEYFIFELYDSRMQLKKEVVIRGNERSEAANDLNNVPYEIGDYIYVYHKEASGKKLLISGVKGDNNTLYAEGTNNLERGKKLFKVTDTGLEVVTNDAPTITIGSEAGYTEVTENGETVWKKTIKRGDDIDLSNGITISDTFDQANHIPLLLNYSVFNNMKLGEQTVIYTLTDSWGATVTKKAIITVQPKNDLEQVKFKFYSKDTNNELFNMTIDSVNHKIEVNRVSSNNQAIKGYSGAAFKIKIIDGVRNVVKREIAIRGTETGFSSALDRLDGYSYNNGDRISIWALNTEDVKIEGDTNIKDKPNNVNYASGLTNRDYLDNVRFEMNENKLKYIYNKAPTITFAPNTVLEVVRGEELNTTIGVTITDDYDKEETINVENVKVVGFDKYKLGEQNVTYQYTDSWGRTGTATRIVRVLAKNKLEDNTVKMYKDGTNTPILTISFDDITRKLKVSDATTDTINGVNEVALVIKTYRHGSVERTLDINGNMSGIQIKNIIENLNINYEYGDMIDFVSTDSTKLNRVRVFGSLAQGSDDNSNKTNSTVSREGEQQGNTNVPNSNANAVTNPYNDGFATVDNMKNTRFELTKDGIKAIYNKAPVLSGLDELKIIKGNEPQFRDGVTVTDELDDDNTLTNAIQIDSSDFNKNAVGVYGVTYTVTDTWGRSTSQVRNVRVVSKVENNVISLDGDDDNKLFEIGFDTVRNKLTFKKSEQNSGAGSDSSTDGSNGSGTTEQPEGGNLGEEQSPSTPEANEENNHSSRTASSETTTNKLFEIKVFDDKMKLVGTATLNGNTDSDYNNFKIELEKINMYESYYVSLWASNHNKLKISGNVIKTNGVSEEDYSNGINSEDQMINVRFESTEEGLKAIYNAAPVISMKSSTTPEAQPQSTNDSITALTSFSHYLGETYKLTENMQVTDDKDTNISVDDIKTTYVRKEVSSGNVNSPELSEASRATTENEQGTSGGTSDNNQTTESAKNSVPTEVGTYIVTYTVTDSWGREAVVTRELTIKKGLERHELIFGGYNKTGNIEEGFDAFKLKFVEDNNNNIRIQIENKANKQLHTAIGQQTVYTIQVLDSSNNVQGAVNLEYNSNAHNFNFTPLTDISIKYGYKIKVKAIQPFRFKITGEIIGAKEDYSDAVQNKMNLEYVTFRITKNGLVSEFNDTDVTNGVKNIITNIEPGGLQAFKIKFDISDNGSNTNNIGKIIVEGYREPIIYQDETKALTIKLVRQGLDTIESTFIGTESGKKNETELNDKFASFNNQYVKEGDYIEFWAKSPSRLFITGNLIKSNHDYVLGGTEDLYANTRFYFTSKGIKPVYNNAPQIIADDIDIYSEDYINGKQFDFKTGVTVTDDHDKINDKGELIPESTSRTTNVQNNNRNVLTYRIKEETRKEDDTDTSINFAQLGERIVTYSYTDSWGRTGTFERKVTVRPQLYKNKIQVYAEDNESVEARTSISEDIVGDGTDNNPEDDREDNQGTTPQPPESNDTDRDDSSDDDITKKEPVFEIGFNTLTNNYQVINRKDEYLDIKNPRKDIFAIQIKGENGEVKFEETLKGNDKGSSEKLNELNELEYRETDIIRVWRASSNSSEGTSVVVPNLKITGNIEKHTEITEEDYSNGIKNIDFMNNVGFKPVSTGLQAIYNKAPEINGFNDSVEIVEKGTTFNLRTGVTVTDDRDQIIPIDRVQITGTVDTNVLGVYKVTYTVTDSWNRTTSKVRTINVVSKVKNNSIEVYNPDNENDNLLFKIIFDANERKFKLEKNNSNLPDALEGNDSTSRTTDDNGGEEQEPSTSESGEEGEDDEEDRPPTSGDADTKPSEDNSDKIFRIKIFNANGGIVVNSSVNSDVSTTNNLESQLSDLTDYIFNIGDSISLWTNNSNKVKVIGHIEGKTHDYNTGLKEENDMNSVRFRITENGLKEIGPSTPEINFAEGDNNSVEVKRGDTVNYLNNITIVDATENIAFEKVKYNEQGIDVNTIGEKTLEYSVTNSWSVTTTKIRKFNVVPKNDIDGVRLKLKSESNNENYLELGFDELTHKLKVYKELTEALYPDDEENVLTISIYTASGSTLKTLQIQGNKLIDNEQIKRINEVEYEEGLFIGVETKYPKNLSITGNIEKVDNLKGHELDLTDGIDEDELEAFNNTRFKIGATQIQAIYNEAPVITYPKQNEADKGIITVKKGEIYDYNQDLTVTDDHDGNIEPSNVGVDESRVNYDEVGTYEITYIVTDSWGRDGTATRPVKIVSNIVGNQIDIYSKDSTQQESPSDNETVETFREAASDNVTEEGNNSPEDTETSAPIKGNRVFSIGFIEEVTSNESEDKNIKIKLEVRNKKDTQIDSANSDKEAVKIIAYNKNGNKKNDYELSLNGNDTGTSEKLEKLKTWELEYGDYISLYASDLNEPDSTTNITPQQPSTDETPSERNISIINENSRVEGSSGSNSNETVEGNGGGNSGEENSSTKPNKPEITTSMIRITGGVLNARELYDSGAVKKDNIVNVRFEITDAGLEALYNDAPNIYISSGEFSKYLGETYKLTEGVNVYDDLDGTLGEKNIITTYKKLSDLPAESTNGSTQSGSTSSSTRTSSEGSGNLSDGSNSSDTPNDGTTDENNNTSNEDTTNKLPKDPGIYEITYIATDSWGRQSSKTRKITIKKGMDRHELHFGGHDQNASENSFTSFKIKFKEINNTQVKLIIYDKENKVVHNEAGTQDIYKITIYDENGSEVRNGKIQTLENPKTTSNNQATILALNDFKFKYGYSFKIEALQPFRFSMTGEILGDVFEDFSDGVQNRYNLDKVTFTVTKNGLVAKYSDTEISHSSQNMITSVERGGLNPFKINVETKTSMNNQNIPGIPENSIGKLVITEKEEEIIWTENGKVIEDAMTLKLVRANGREKISETFNSQKATEPSNKSKFDKFNNQYVYNGDYLEITHQRPEIIYIMGNKHPNSNSKVDYREGAKNADNLNNVRFYFIDNSENQNQPILMPVYNEAPEITGINFQRVPVNTSYDLLQGVVTSDQIDDALNKKVKLVIKCTELGINKTITQNANKVTSSNGIRSIFSRTTNSTNSNDNTNLFNKSNSSEETIATNEVRNITEFNYMFDTSGIFNIEYTMTDSWGRTTTEYRTIQVYGSPEIDPKKDVVQNETTEQGEKVGTVTVELNSMKGNIEAYMESYFRSLVSISDVEDDDKDLIVEVTGKVEPDKVGTYPVNYKVTDTHGNITMYKINVNVVKTIKATVTTDIPFQVVTNLLNENGTTENIKDRFVSSKIRIKNNNPNSKMEVYVKGLSKSEGELELVNPSDTNFESLDKFESLRKMALGLYFIESTNVGDEDIREGENSELPTETTKVFTKESPLWLTTDMAQTKITTMNEASGNKNDITLPSKNNSDTGTTQPSEGDEEGNEEQPSSRTDSSDQEGENPPSSTEEDEKLKNPDYYIKDYGTVEGKVLEFGLTAKYGNNFAGGKVRGKFKLIFEFR